MVAWHEHQAALEEFNGAMMLEGNRHGPVHPSWKQHDEVLRRAQESVGATFHAAAAAEGIDPVAHTRDALESAYDRQVSQYASDAEKYASAARVAAKMPAQQAKWHLGQAGIDAGDWRGRPKSEMLRDAESRATAAIEARDTLVQRPYSVHADQTEIAQHFPEHVRDRVAALPSPVVEDLRNRAREYLRPASQR